MSFDLRELRNAFGSFLTGVTVVTTYDEHGDPTGFTANSFTSVSLDPPLLLVCLSKNADCFDIFMKTENFAINILAEHQQELSTTFSRKNTDKFDGIELRNIATKSPVFSGNCAWFDCAVEQRHDGGDHIILMGRVLEYRYREREPLGFIRGGYVSLGMERSAVSAWSSAKHLVAGAIIDQHRSLLIIDDPQGDGVSLPTVTAKPYTNPLKQIEAMLVELGLTASQPFLYSVHMGADGTQYIYYRFQSAVGAPSRGRFVNMDEVPVEHLPNYAVRGMVQRYSRERVHQRFGVYLGDSGSGVIS
jgi:flavin reductase (DIM6/NTAB) family NADH-FMN oxidoreductase RutF